MSIEFNKWCLCHIITRHNALTQKIESSIYTNYVLQAYVLNHYLVTYYNKWWLFWIVPDVLVVVCFLAAFIVAFFYLQKKKKKSFKFKSKIGKSFLRCMVENFMLKHIS